MGEMRHPAEGRQHSRGGGGLGAVRASVSPFVHTGSQEGEGFLRGSHSQSCLPRGGPGEATRLPPPPRSPLRKAGGVGKPLARGSPADASGFGVPRAGPARGRGN